MIVLLAIAVWACLVGLVLALCVSARDGDREQAITSTQLPLSIPVGSDHDIALRRTAMALAGGEAREVQRTEAA
jgi:hypothetical protein